MVHGQRAVPPLSLKKSNGFSDISIQHWSCMVKGIFKRMCAQVNKVKPEKKYSFWQNSLTFAMKHSSL
jgi:hypothetical protein